jgi:hypothetical protein
VHDLPDFVYFNHSIHINKGVGCYSCHGQVDAMPLMYEENTLQMEWCLDCHRNPAKNLRPTSQIYNMAWEKPADERPVWCAVNGEKDGVPTAEAVSCVLQNPVGSGTQNPQVASLELPGNNGLAGDVHPALQASSPMYRKFTSQDELGHFLLQHYKIRAPKDLMSCEVCHR